MLTTDETYVREAIWWANKHIFDGEVPVDLIDLDVEFQDDVWGYCVPDEDGGERITLGLTDQFDSVYQLNCTIVHELIHAVQIFNEAKVGHGTAMWRYYVDRAFEAGLRVAIVD